MIKIAFFSFADIDNFGDILFSHIFKMEMEKRIKQIQIDFYSPSSCRIEGIDYHSYSKERIKQNHYDALIVFGGEVVHLYDDRTWKPIYDKRHLKIDSELPSDIIFDWVDIPKPFKAWVSVGVRPIENQFDYQKISRAIDSLDYLSVRGIISKKILEGLNLQYNNTKIEVTPDMGWLFPDLLTIKNIKGKLYKKLVHSANYLVFQINNITIQEAEEIAKYLRHFKESHDIDIVLLPIIRPWEDFKYLKLIFDFFPKDFRLLDNNLSILELADILVHAKIVLSSSLHANITALAVGKPAGIINKWHGTKLQDIYAHQFRNYALRHKIDEIPSLLNQLYNESHDKSLLNSYAEFMRTSVRKVFNDLAEKIIHKNNE